MVTVVQADASDRGTRLVRVGTIAFVAVFLSWGIFTAVNRSLNEIDLSVYRDGGLIVRHIQPYYAPDSYAPLYDWGGFSPLALKFTYPPFAAITFAFVSMLPWVLTWVLSVPANIAAFLLAMWFTVGGLGYRDRRVRLGVTLLAAAGTFWLQPVIRTIYLGQVNLFLMALIMGDLCQPPVTKSGRDRWWQGLLTGVAAGIKITPLIFVPYLLITRRFRQAGMAVAGFLATVAVGFAVLPHDSTKWWLRGMLLSDGNRTGFIGWAGNQSLRAVITRFSGSVAAGQGPWIVAGAIALILGLTAAYLLNRAGYPLPALLVTALSGLLFSPVSWDHHWVWVAPGAAVTGHYAIRAWRAGDHRSARWLWGLIAGMVFFFAAWPDALWENARTLGNLSLGFLWAQSNTNPLEFAQHGDNPAYVEYHWHGFQLLWGNAYVIGGVALLIVALWLGFRLKRPPAAEAPVKEPATAAL